LYNFKVVFFVVKQKVELIDFQLNIQRYLGQISISKVIFLTNKYLNINTNIYLLQEILKASLSGRTKVKILEGSLYQLAFSKF
jgi:hypothetical protein